jgi:hypothetical protein
MSDDKQLTIHFNNGTTMQVSFPAQAKNSLATIVEGIKRILESDKLVIQTDERVIVVPWSSVKYLEAASVPANVLPFGAFVGATILSSEGGASKC